MEEPCAWPCHQLFCLNEAWQYNVCILNQNPEVKGNIQCHLMGGARIPLQVLQGALCGSEHSERPSHYYRHCLLAFGQDQVECLFLRLLIIDVFSNQGQLFRLCIHYKDLSSI